MAKAFVYGHHSGNEIFCCVKNLSSHLACWSTGNPSSGFMASGSPISGGLSGASVCISVSCIYRKCQRSRQKNAGEWWDFSFSEKKTYKLSAIYSSSVNQHCTWFYTIRRFDQLVLVWYSRRMLESGLVTILCA